MKDGSLPEGRRFAQRAIGLSCALTLPGAGMILASLFVLLELRAEQWNWFLAVLTAYGVLIAPFLAVRQLRFLAPLTDYLDARRSGDVSEEQRHQAEGGDQAAEAEA